MNAVYNFREFQSALKRVAHAASNDPDRPVLNLAHVIGSRHNTKITTADGFRLAVAKMAAPASGEAFDILLDPGTIKAIVGYKLPKKEDPEIILDVENLIASVNGKSLGRIFNGHWQDDQGNYGTYPDTNQIIPTKSTTSFSVYPLPLMQALKTARVFTREGSNAVQLHISDSLVVVGKSEETGESVSVVSTYRREGPELLIAFNADFLIDLLKVAGTDLVKFEFNKATMPALITTKDDLLGVIMPMNYHDGVTFRRADDIPAPSADPTGESYVWPGSPETPDHYEWLYDRVDGKHAPIDYEGDDYVNRPNQWKITDDMFISTPEPGAVEYDLTGAMFDMAEEKKNWKEVKTPRITLELSNPRPIPNNTFPIVVYDPNFHRAPQAAPVAAPAPDPELDADHDEEPLPTEALNRLFGALVEIAASVPDHPEPVPPAPEVIETLKAHGGRWGKRRGAWYFTRHLTEAEVNSWIGAPAPDPEPETEPVRNSAGTLVTPALAEEWDRMQEFLTPAEDSPAPSAPPEEAPVTDDGPTTPGPVEAPAAPAPESWRPSRLAYFE